MDFDFMGGSMDFADLVTGDYEHFEAARNSCAQASMLPANGLLYTFPHACGCYPMHRGFLRLTSNTDAADQKELPVLQRGPAAGTWCAALAVVVLWGYAGSEEVMRELPPITPHVATLLVLVFASSRLRMPAANGLRYRRGQE